MIRKVLCDACLENSCDSDYHQNKATHQCMNCGAYFCEECAEEVNFCCECTEPRNIHKIVRAKKGCELKNE